MSVENSFFGYHTAEAKILHPTVRCPLLLAELVLERLGVNLSEAEFTEFAKDLASDGLKTVVRDSCDETEEMS